MEPGDLPAYLDRLSDRIASGSPPAVIAMADTYQTYVKDVQLVKYGVHAQHTLTPSPPFVGSPAIETGELRRSVTLAPGSMGIVSHASVSPHTIYAAVQEYGRVIHSRSAHHFMRFVTYGLANGPVFYKHVVKVPPRPYMRPATDACIRNGSLGRSAAEAFSRAVWGSA